MPQHGTIYRVLVASPSDCLKERQLVRDVIYGWNSAHSLPLGAILEPVMWETHARPELGDRPQAIINKQLVDNCDILVGTFWTRLGTSTGKAESGTVEEIEEFRSKDKRVLLYFSSAPVVPERLDATQYQALTEYKEKLGKDGLYFRYESLDRLRDLLQTHIAGVMAELHSRYGSSLPQFVDCYDAGLFATTIIWAAQESGSPQYQTAVEQLQISLKKLHLAVSSVDSLTTVTQLPTPVALMLHARDGMKILHDNVATKIEGRHGKKSYYCFQLGVNLGNLVWCSKFLADAVLTDKEDVGTSEQVRDTLNIYMQALQEFSVVLGDVEPVNSFIRLYNPLLTGMVTKRELAMLYAEGGRVFPITRAWIEGNVKSA